MMYIVAMRALTLAHVPRFGSGAILALVLSAAAGAAAERAPGDGAVPGAVPVSIDEVIRQAVTSNPGVTAARAVVDAAKARTGVDAAYEDPSLTATWIPESASQGKQESREFMLRQTVPFPGKIGAVRQARHAQETAAVIEFERAIRDVTLGVRESAIEIEYLRRARAIAAGSRELLGRLRAAGASAYAQDRTGLYELLRAQSQESQTVFDAALLAELEQTEVARLNSLLSRPTDTAVDRIDLRAGRPLVVDLAAITDSAATKGREVVLARAETDRARAETRVAALEGRPEFMLGVGYMQELQLQDMASSNRWEVELGLTLPVFVGKNAARRAEAAADVARSQALERKAADEARAAVREAWFRLRNAERLVALYRDTLVPQAFASVQLAETWLRAGTGSFADVVDATTLWYTFQLASARAAADREKYLARLEALAERSLAAPQAGPGPGGEADAASWEAAVAQLQDGRAGLERDGAVRVLNADPERSRALAAAADDAAAAADALFPQTALADLEILVLLRSPAIRSAERAWRASLEQYSQVVAVDEVARRYASATSGLTTGVAGTMGDTPEMRFPFPGALALKGEIVAADAKAAREDLERSRRDALAEARRLYWALVLAHRSVTLLAEIGDLLEQRVAAVQLRYESGQGSLADIVQARIALEISDTEGATAAGERDVVEAQLRSLLALPRGTVIGLPRDAEGIPAAADTGALAALALEKRQELRRMRAMAARMELMLQMTAREATPGFATEASSFDNRPLLQEGTMAMEKPFPAAITTLDGTGTPKYAFSGRIAGYVRETRDRLAALREDIRAEEEATVARVREAAFVLDRARREERLWAVKVGELTRMAGETTDRAYRAGRSTLPEALEAARAARESLLEAARRHAAAGQAWAALEAAVGAPLDGGAGAP